MAGPEDRLPGTDHLLGGAHAANRPVFQFGGPHRLHAPATLSGAIPVGQLGLSGPSEALDAAHWPVRGDLAHIALAGRCFVPHYAVPMPHRLLGAAPLRRAGRDAAEVLTDLAEGAVFDVLDMSGGWCWGQAGAGGFVGYIRQEQLEPAA